MLGKFKKRPSGAFDRSSDRLPAPNGLGLRFCRTSNGLFELENDLFRPESQTFAARPAEFRASRKPLLFLRFAGSLVLRFADRQFAASLFQLPPRITRFEPLRIVHRQRL